MPGSYQGTAIAVASVLADAKRALNYAHWRCDPIDRAVLFGQVAQAWEIHDLDELRTRLRQLDLSGDDRGRFVSALEELLAASENVPSRAKARVDRFAYWRSSSYRQPMPVPSSRRGLATGARAGRRLAYKLVRRMDLERAVLDRLVLAWERFHDIEAVRALVRVAEGLRAVDVDAVLRSLDEADSRSVASGEYWQARVLERLIKDDPPEAIRRASARPVAFIRAVGRVGDTSWLPQARACFDEASSNPRVLGIAASVAGRMGDRALLSMVETAAATHESAFAVSHPWYRAAGGRRAC